MKYKHDCLLLWTNTLKHALSSIVAFSLSVSCIFFVSSSHSGHFFALHPTDVNLLNNSYQRIELDKAWEICQGTRDFTIGLIDSGIDGSNLDVFPNINSTLSASFYDSSENPFVDFAGHGKYVVQYLGAIGNNGVGSAGVVWNADIASLKVSRNYDPYLEDLNAFLDAVSYAALKGIPIVNFSGGFYYDLFSFISLDVAGIATVLNNYSGLIVCAAGNENMDLDVNYLIPAILPLDNILVVGASRFDSDAMYSNHTNFGEHTVDLFAPAEWTSFAAPLVTGTAAMMLAINPTLSTSQLKRLILENVDHSDDLEGICFSEGRLNVYKAIKAAIPAIGLGTNYSIKPLKYGEDHWYRFICDPGVYTFSSVGNCQTIGELYYDIQSSPVCISSPIGSGNDFTMTHNISSQGKYYLKVKTVSGVTPSNYVIYISNHDHLYNYSYSTSGPTKHRCYCQCGDYILKPHIYPVEGGVVWPCTVCGQPYTLPPLDNAVPLGTDSYIGNDGNLFLSQNDYGDLIYYH